jgi:hypothetical protein
MSTVNNTQAPAQTAAVAATPAAATAEAKKQIAIQGAWKIGGSILGAVALGVVGTLGTQALMNKNSNNPPAL